MQRLTPTATSTIYLRNLPLPPVDPNVTLVIPNPTMALTQAPTLPVFTYFRTSGNQIVDRMGNAVRFTAVNWFAMPCHAP